MESILTCPPPYDGTTCPAGGPPFIDPIFGPTRSSFYWSSSTGALDFTDAWFVVFGNGVVSSDDRSTFHFVRAVRGGS